MQKIVDLVVFWPHILSEMKNDFGDIEMEQEFGDKKVLKNGDIKKVAKIFW